MKIKAELIVSLSDLYRRAVARDDMILAEQAIMLQDDIIDTVPWHMQGALIKTAVELLQ